MWLSSAYLGNIQYYTKLLSGRAVIDLCENYQKQSYRNRCEILTANGPCALIVPVLHPSGMKIPIQQLRIDASKRWQHQHWQAIVSAYRNAAYFSHYEAQLAPFYHRPYTTLVEWNEALQSQILSLLHITAPLHYTTQYETLCPQEEDWRIALSPKVRLQHPDPHFTPEPYYQVFADRYPFVPNLSILDLLFCEGPAAVEVLQRSTLAR
ncbi:MAG: WbqC family protein [Alistipes sp.]|nr:WbqC family protein [Alistipes sp.]